MILLGLLLYRMLFESHLFIPGELLSVSGSGARSLRERRCGPVRSWWRLEVRVGMGMQRILL